MTETENNESQKSNTKICTKCEKELPATFEYFYRKESIKEGLRSQCKECVKEYQQSKKGKEYKKKTNKKYRESEKGKETIKKWNENNHDYFPQWHENHPEWREKYKQNHPHRIRDYFRKMKKDDLRKYKQYLEYKKIHEWVKRNKPKQEYCTICNEIKELELSNISGEYKRDITDFWYLCNHCHRLFDKINQTHKKQ